LKRLVGQLEHSETKAYFNAQRAVMWLAVMDLGEDPRATVTYIFIITIRTCMMRTDGFRTLGLYDVRGIQI